MIYFDSAATSLQKPPTVRRAMGEAMATMASPGRGDYGPAARAAKTLLACREEAAALFQVAEPERVILTTSATHGLNIAIKTLVKPGSTVLLTGYEHNAVTRPLAAIPEVHLRTLRTPLFQPERLLEELDRQLDETVDVVICTHVSNVFGFVLPVEEIAARCRRRQVPLIVDAAQSAGLLPIRMEDWGAEFVAMPGHKGLYGPQGTGLLLCRGEKVQPLMEGGTGSLSMLQEMPDFLPDRLEAGTHNVPGAAGLLEGMRFVRKRGTEKLLRHEIALKNQAAAGLARLPGVQVFASREHQSGVLSFRLADRDAGQAGEWLARQGLALRTGLHCAPQAHITAGTEKTGTLRVSFSAFNTPREVERFLELAGRMPS